jgi:hypothetical protein
MQEKSESHSPSIDGIFLLILDDRSTKHGEPLGEREMNMTHIDRRVFGDHCRRLIYKRQVHSRTESGEFHSLSINEIVLTIVDLRSRIERDSFAEKEKNFSGSHYNDGVDVEIS